MKPYRAAGAFMVLLGVLVVGVSLGLGLSAIPVKATLCGYGQNQLAATGMDAQSCGSVIDKLNRMSMYAALGGLAVAGSGAAGIHWSVGNE